MAIDGHRRLAALRRVHFDVGLDVLCIKTRDLAPAAHMRKRRETSLRIDAKTSGCRSLGGEFVAQKLAQKCRPRGRHDVDIAAFDEHFRRERDRQVQP